MNIDVLQYQYTLNLRVAQLNCEGISEEQAMQSFQGSASVNWLVGHILQSRNNVIADCGFERLQSEEIMQWYRPSHESQVREGSPASLEQLFGWWQESQPMFIELMQQYIDSLDSASVAKGLRDFAFRSFHESYHVGQIAILRRNLGLEGKIA